MHGSWQIRQNWCLERAHRWAGMDIHVSALPFEEHGTPEQFAYPRSALDLAGNLELNAAIHHVDRIAHSKTDAGEFVDLGLSWRPPSKLERALWANIFRDCEHQEGSAAVIPRSVHAQLTWRSR